MSVFSLASKSAVKKVLERLESAGMLERTTDGDWAPAAHFFERAVATQPVAAGMPIAADQNSHEQITLDRFLIDKPTKTVLIRVKGDSMIDAGIHSGDLAVVERTTEARTGTISRKSTISNEMVQKLRSLSSPLSKPLLLAYYGAIVLVLVAAATQTLGLLQGDVVVLYAYLFHSFISSVLILFLLIFRGRNLQRQQNEIASQMARTQGELTAQRLAQEDQGRMVEMLGHEIKTPLAVLQFAIDEWVTDDKEREKVNESIDQIKTLTERSIDAILQSRTEVTFETVDLIPLIHRQVNSTNEPDRFSLSIPDVAVIYSNALMIEQVFGNLFDNALKYGKDSSPIEVIIRLSEQERLGKESGGFEITISNQVGLAGLPEPEMVFKKYYRAEGSKSQSGSGLGLYLVQAFIRFLNGEIDYRCRDNRVEFVLWLPVKKF